MVGTVAEASTQAQRLIQEDISKSNFPTRLDTSSPDGDPGKFLLEGRVARVIHRRDGFYAKINLGWFEGDLSPPEINGTSFYWYVFALAPAGSNTAQSYFICSYPKMRELVLDFDEPLGIDHRDHSTWNGRIFFLDDDLTRGYFTWQDEDAELRKPNRFIRLRNIEEVTGEQVTWGFIDEAQKDLDAYSHTYSSLPETERDAVVKSRIGQGLFRENLVNYWQGCSVTGVSSDDFVIASHIKPWRDASNEERLDPFNGLLLIPNLDWLFDRGFISFAVSGEILISSQLDDLVRNVLGVNPNMKLRKLRPEISQYLSYHRHNLYKA